MTALDYKFENNAVTTLASGIIGTTTTLSVTDGSVFPSLTGDGTDFFLVTLVKTSGTKEIVCIVARSSNTLTVGIPGSGSANVNGRDYENDLGAGTTFSADDYVELRITAGIMEELRDRTAPFTWTAGQRATITTLTDNASVDDWDMEDGNDYKITLGGNRTIANPSNQVAGQGGYLYVVQDGTGGRTLSWNAVFKFKNGTAPTLATDANSIDVMTYHIYSANNIMISHMGVFS